MKKVRVKLKNYSYNILIKAGLLDQARKIITKTSSSDSLIVISDKTVSRLYSRRLLQNLSGTGVNTELITVPDGEHSKSIETLKDIYIKLIKLKVKRDSCIIALGGGVIGDLAGFAAATFLRGIPYIQIPTTLLAQVDSSVGGKTAINHPLGKNLIGNFYQPLMVLIDPLVLKTLDKREINSGLGEIIKYSLIKENNLFDLLKNSINTFYTFNDINLISQVIYQCCRIKADIVSKDEKEKNLRKILNFGHSIGHALEAVTDYTFFRHGEAVLYGIKWAAFVSQQKGLINKSDFKRIESLLKLISLPPLPEDINENNLFYKTLIDKKQTHQGLNIVLLKVIGKTEIIKENNLKSYIKIWLEYEKNN
ncbi:MAG: 3-dehydroquinate synthase [bacterium]